MNPAPPPLPASAPLPAAPWNPAILPAFGIAAALTFATDFLLWPALGSLSYGLWIALLAIAFAAYPRHRQPRVWICAALVVLSGLQAAFHLHLIGAWVPLVLILVIAGEAALPAATTFCGRLLDALVALFLSLAVWRHMARALRHLRPGPEIERRGWYLAVRAFCAVAPALLVALIFIGIFSSGNVIFSEIVSHTFDQFWQALLHLDFTVPRLLFWAVVLTAALALLVPASTRLSAWLTRYEVRRWRRHDARLALWQSGAMLVVLSALFFFVNTIDAIYLWSRAALPAGVNASAYVHQGVLSLIIAVLVSAVLLAVLFQQEGVRESRLLRWLATLWIAQNFILIIGVFLRLKLYVDTYQLTLLRIGVGLFLTLVLVGFGLLAFFIWRNRSFLWLVKMNTASILAFFYLLQFANLDGWVAAFNTNRWLHDYRAFDREYALDLGAAAWPALIRQVEANRAASLETFQQLRRAAVREEARLQGLNWREREVVRDRLGRTLVAYVRERSESEKISRP